MQDDVEYAQALTVGDAWIAVGPSDDVLALARKSSLVRVAVPESGTALFADVWCVPASAARKRGGEPAGEPVVGLHHPSSRANLTRGSAGSRPGLFDGDAVDYAATRMDGPTGGFVRYDVGDADRGSWFKSAFANVFGGDGTDPRGWRSHDRGMPPDEVWAASEFLEPLAPRGEGIQRRHRGMGRRKVRCEPTEGASTGGASTEGERWAANGRRPRWRMRWRIPHIRVARSYYANATSVSPLHPPSLQIASRAATSLSTSNSPNSPVPPTSMSSTLVSPPTTPNPVAAARTSAISPGDTPPMTNTTTSAASLGRGGAAV